MIERILNLYPNLKMIYENLVEDDKVRYAEFLIGQFTIEKRPLDQILKRIDYRAGYKSEKNPYLCNLPID